VSAAPGPVVPPLVLVVEDDPHLVRFLRASVAAQGYRLLFAGTGGEAIALAEQYPPDLVLLDLGLPDIDGVEVARRLRRWSHVPILVLSARGLETQKVEALDAGADDYVTKPFSFVELLARMRAALRRSAGDATDPAEPVFRSGPLRVDFAARRVTLGEQEVHLTRTEFQILATLVRHAGRVVTHGRLLETVWGPRQTEHTNYLRVYMAHLRRKLEPDPLRPRLFQTEPGVGYRLVVEAER